MGTGYKLTAATKTQNNEMKPLKRNDQNQISETTETTKTRPPKPCKRNIITETITISEN